MKITFSNLPEEITEEQIGIVVTHATDFVDNTVSGFMSVALIFNNVVNGLREKTIKMFESIDGYNKTLTEAKNKLIEIGYQENRLTDLKINIDF
jgi:hypothetical protein